ncbi:MAG: N-acetylmuramoyl-L-alanine amidase family protein [Bacillota bacterium]
MVRLVVRNIEVVHPNGAFGEVPEALWAAARGLEVPFFFDAASGTVHLDSAVHGRTVVIDPGHGGKDRGGRGVMGYCEAEGTWGIARALGELLRSAGARVILTRAQDETLSLEQRLAVVEGEHPDALVCLHTEGLFAGGGLRPAVIFNYRCPLASFRMAGCIVAEMSTFGGMPPFLRRFRLASRSLGGYNGLLLRSGAPAVLIQCASHHYPEQERLLMDQGYLRHCALSIFRGLCRHFGAELTDRADIADELLGAAQRKTPGPLKAVPQPEAERPMPAQEPVVALAEPPREPAKQAPAAAPMPAPALTLGSRAIGVTSPSGVAQSKAPALAYAQGQLFQVAPPGSVQAHIGLSGRAAEVMAGVAKDTGLPVMPPEFLHWPAPKTAGSPVKPHG